jgi:hypothetical protein
MDRTAAVRAYVWIRALLHVAFILPVGVVVAGGLSGALVLSRGTFTAFVSIVFIYEGFLALLVGMGDLLLGDELLRIVREDPPGPRWLVREWRELYKGRTAREMRIRGAMALLVGLGAIGWALVQRQFG